MDSKVLKFLSEQFGSIRGEIHSYRDEMVGFKDGVYEKMDAVYKELLVVRQEQVMHTGSHQRLDEELNYIRSKIKKLESKKSAVV